MSGLANGYEYEWLTSSIPTKWGPKFRKNHLLLSVLMPFVLDLLNVAG